MKLRYKKTIINNVKIKDLIFFILSFLQKKYQLWYNFSGKYYFTDRSNNQKKLLLVVAGYKEYLWKFTLERIKLFCDKDIDVCLVLPGIQNEKLIDICKNNNWSYLITKENKLSLAQNIAIKKHPQAKYIYKLDEDIFVGKNYFKNLLSFFINIKKKNIINPSFVAPILNINLFTYIYFLKTINKTDEYIKKFGKLEMSLNGKIWEDPETAKFIWDNTKDLDNLILKFKNENNNLYKIAPIRFSIGAILFERSVWEKMNGFNVKLGLGYEEEQINAYSFNNCQPIVISLENLVGHFSYGPQNEKMIEYLNKNKSFFYIYN